MSNLTKIEELLRAAAEQEARGERVSFKVEPVHLSPEHARHYERFTGVPYDAEAIARTTSWVAFKVWHHRLQVAGQALPPKPARTKQ